MVDIILAIEFFSTPISFFIFSSILIPYISLENIVASKLPELSVFSSVKPLRFFVVFESPFIKFSSITLNEFKEI